MIPRRLHAGLLLVVLSGCGGSEDVKTAPVSGKVTVDGKPREELLVRFEPTGSGGLSKEGWSDSSGITDAEGRYVLKTPTDLSGAVVGSHRVTITDVPIDEALDPTSEGAAAPKTRPKATIPEKYNTRSTLEFNVPKEGTDKADFPLSSK